MSSGDKEMKKKLFQLSTQIRAIRDNTTKSNDEKKKAIATLKNSLTANEKSYMEKVTAKAREAKKAAALKSTNQKRPNRAENVVPENALQTMKAIEPGISNENAISLYRRQQILLGASGLRKATPPTVPSTVTKAETTPSPKATPAASLPPRILGICPLVNPGINACYMNSSFQVLFTIPELRAFLTGLTDEQINSAVSTCSEVSKERIQGSLTALRTLFRELEAKAPTGTAVDISTVGRTLPGGVRGKRDPNSVYTKILESVEFEPFQQNDAATFITILIFNLLFCSSVARDLQSLFSINLEDTIKCKDVTIPNIRREEVGKVLDLSIEGKNGDTVQDLLDCFQKSEEPCEDYMYERCGKEGQMGRVLSKTIEIKIPDTTRYLFLGLRRGGFNRYAPANQEAYSIDKPIQLSNRILIDGKYFKLKMAICKLGPPEGGHYIAYTFDETGNPVYELNDDTVKAYNADGTFFSQWRSKGPYATKGARRGMLIQQTSTVLLYKKTEPINVKGGGKRKTRRARRHRKRSTRKH